MINYLKYPIYLGGNRGRGQLYPDGSKSNNKFLMHQFLVKLLKLTQEKNLQVL